MAIHFNSEKKIFTLSGKNFSYVMTVNKYGYLTHLYYGEKIPVSDLTYFEPVWEAARTTWIPNSKSRYEDLMLEFAMPSLGDFRESAFLCENENGARAFDMRFKDFEILKSKPSLSSAMPVAQGGETLVITLSEVSLSFDVKLYYTVYENENIITRRAEYVNNSKGDIKLLRALSMTLDLYDSDYKLLKLWGHHENECNTDINELHHGIQSTGSTRGASSHEANPFVALMRKNADEESGAVIGCVLMYSGSHYESVEVDASGRARLSAGINPFDFSWKLASGESFETPEAVLCYSLEGLGGMSRGFHDFFRNHVINKKYVFAPRPIVFNSWEGMHFDFDRDRIFGAIDDITGTGIDTFVLDDGWFGQRNDSSCALGDWYVNTKKLKGGLSAISDYCHKNGLRFGLWIEPEMICPDSDLYRKHPDWAITTPNHMPILGRSQCVLDLTRRDVLDYIKDLMYKVISESGADYIKWDHNRIMTDNFSHLLPPDRQHETQHRFILGTYELAKFLTESFPDVLFEGCASGGGRFDGAMLAYFPQIWASDDTDAHERTIIQYGTSLCYPLSASSNHISISPNLAIHRITPWETRRDIALNGAFGYEFDTKKISSEDLAKIPDDVKKYRGIQELVLHGDLYRMKNTNDSEEFSQIIVSKDKSRGYLTYYRSLAKHKGAPRIKANGLDDNKLYKVEELDMVLYGAVIRNVGIPFKKIKGDFITITLTFNEVK